MQNVKNKNTDISLNNIWKLNVLMSTHPYDIALRIESQIVSQQVTLLLCRDVKIGIGVMQY